MGLQLRDLCVLLLCAGLSLLALQQEGDLEVQPAWFQPLEHHSDSSSHARGATDSSHIMSTYANGIAPLENEMVSVTTQCGGLSQSEESGYHGYSAHA